MDFAINAGKYCSFNMRGTHAEVSFLWVYIFSKHCNVLGELLTLQSFGGHCISHVIFTNMSHPSLAFKSARSLCSICPAKFPNKNCFYSFCIKRVQ